MKKMAKKKARREIDLEQYYTQPELAQRLIKKTTEILQLNKEKDFLVEPSAGDGSFSDKIIEEGFKNYKFFDIEPMKEGINKQDFFLLQDRFDGSVFIGNPPFGYKGKMAIDFINHSFEIGAKYVAFILPYTFSIRYSVQNKIKRDASLIYEEIIVENSIYKNKKNNKKYEIKCAFQIWQSSPSTKDIRIKARPRLKHPDFQVHMYNLDAERKSKKWFEQSWDFCIYRQGFFDYKARFFPSDLPNLDLEKYQYMIFKANNKKVLNRLMKMDYETMSKRNMLRPGISVADIVEEYYMKYPSKKKK
jgi:predicted RNA methylase